MWWAGGTHEQLTKVGHIPGKKCSFASQPATAYLAVAYLLQILLDFRGNPALCTGSEGVQNKAKWIECRVIRLLSFSKQVACRMQKENLRPPEPTSKSLFVHLHQDRLYPLYMFSTMGHLITATLKVNMCT
jgi:hypothetical protein